MNSWSKLFSSIESSNLNTFCNKIYYINLDSRKDRLKSINSELSRNKILAERVSGVVPEFSPPNSKITKEEFGCSLSHISIWKDIVKKQIPIACILEDDILFKEHFPILFNRATQNLPKNWDMIYLCGNNYFGLDKFNEYLFRTRGTLTTCAYIVSENMCSKILDYVGDALSKPIDSYLAELHKVTNSYITVPSLAYQMTDYSDIQKRIVDYGFLY